MKTILITGATAGIGKAAAFALAKLGHIIVLLGRNLSKMEQVRTEIQEEAIGAIVHTVVIDLASMTSVKKAANQILRDYAQIDVLVNNAGLMYPKLELTEDGFETQFAVNHLGHFALTLELLPLLKIAPSARIINVSSDMHYKATLDFDDPYMKKGYRADKMYRRTKLCNVLFTYELVRKLGEESSIAVNALHPGGVETGFGGRYLTGKEKVAWEAARLLRKKGISPEEGATTIIYLAHSPLVEGKTGLYYYECKAKKSSDLSYDEGLAKQLWDWSLERVQL